MANSYTAIPNIVPGNLKVNGTLTVSGGQIAMGKFQRQYRIQEIANGQFVETVNVDRIAGAQDDATMASLMRVIYAMGPPFAVATEPAGAPMTDTYLLNQQPAAFQVGTNEVRVGAVLPYMRVLKNVPVGGGYTVNLQQDAMTRDDVTTFGYGLFYDPYGQHLIQQFVNLASVVTQTSPHRSLWADYTPHVMTGFVGTQAVASHTIRAGILNPQTGLFIRLRGKCALTGVGGATLILYLGAGQLAAYSVPPSTTAELLLDVFVVNAGASNAQTTRAFFQFGTQLGTPSAANLTIDTTADVVLQLQVNLAAAADSMTWTMLHATLLDDFTPS